MLSLTITFLLAIHVIVSLLIILLVLMQRPKSEGLGAAFGGGMTENLFGAQTSNVLAGATRWLGGTFFVLTLILSILYAKQSTQRSAIQANLLKQAEAAAQPAPVAAVTGTNALTSGTGVAPSVPAPTGSAAASPEPFSGADIKLGAPVATGTTGDLLPAPALGGTAGH